MVGGEINGVNVWVSGVNPKEDLSGTKEFGYLFISHPKALIALTILPGDPELFRQNLSLERILKKIEDIKEKIPTEERGKMVEILAEKIKRNHDLLRFLQKEFARKMEEIKTNAKERIITNYLWRKNIPERELSNRKSSEMEEFEGWLFNIVRGIYSKLEKEDLKEKLDKIWESGILLTDEGLRNFYHLYKFYLNISAIFQCEIEIGPRIREFIKENEELILLIWLIGGYIDDLMNRGISIIEEGSLMEVSAGLIDRVYEISNILTIYQVLGALICAREGKENHPYLTNLKEKVVPVIVVALGEEKNNIRKPFSKEEIIRRLRNFLDESYIRIQDRILKLRGYLKEKEDYIIVFTKRDLNEKITKEELEELKNKIEKAIGGSCKGYVVTGNLSVIKENYGIPEDPLFPFEWERTGIPNLAKLLMVEEKTPIHNLVYFIIGPKEDGKSTLLYALGLYCSGKKELKEIKVVP